MRPGEMPPGKAGMSPCTGSRPPCFNEAGGNAPRKEAGATADQTAAEMLQ